MPMSNQIVIIKVLIVSLLQANDAQFTKKEIKEL